ncbi:MAG TPA: class I SAM-dependent methyltransferase [Candidatus Saccharimonadales bacterium]|nr:class I SAM-dependent methyltransferase [Candidatus Saccharimonadales bacterium]
MSGAQPYPSPPQFYEAEKINPAEAERLKFMATYADLVSLAALKEVIDAPGAVCVDVGAGDSTSLGEKIIARNPQAKYMPVDMREDAVATHQNAGFDARIGRATDLPFEDDSADALHARFTFGWLDEPSRNRAFEEMLRVGKDCAKIAIIDYDWSVAGGAAPVNNLVRYVTNTMGSFGFNSNYGGEAAAELAANLKDYGYTDTTATVETFRTHISETMERSISTIQATVRPIIEKFIAVGMVDQVGELTALLTEVQNYAAQNPNDIMDFPDIVEVTAKLNNAELHELATARIKTARSLGAESLRNESMMSAGPAILNAYRLPPSMLLQARRLQASAYRDRGHVTDAGVVQDGPLKGVLKNEVYPQELVDRSTFIGAVSQEGVVEGTIALIAPTDGGVRSLPAVAKVCNALGEDSEILRDLPFMQSGKADVVVEATALGKSSQSADKEILSKLLLAAMCQAKEDGNEYVVMTIVEGTARLLTAAYGTQAFKRIDGDAAVVRLTGEGIKPGGINLVPFYVDLNTFIDDCRAHFTKNPGSDFVKANLPLFEATEAFVGKAA